MILGLAVVIVAVILVQRSPSVSTSTAVSTVFDQSVSDGTIKFSYDSKSFGLATSKEQVLVQAYIPPCDENFNYCLYYVGDTYKGTNFESAGFRIQKRTDLSSENSCLTTPPSGFDPSKAPDRKSSGEGYSSSVFQNIGDAGAGHYASGSLYRLYIKAATSPNVTSSCYEFETRIGQTQFANYPAGAIKEFTSNDFDAMQAQLLGMISIVSLQSGSKDLFQ